MSSFENSDEFTKIGLELARITPKTDFIEMFVSLNDYQFQGSFSSDDVCNDCIADLEFALQASHKPVEDFQKAKNCNCRWTCSFWETVSGTDSTTSCKKTSSGCGFLWQYECDERVEP